MTIDTDKFKRGICSKCKRYTSKLQFGKCEASTYDIYDCRDMQIFNTNEFEKWTGIDMFKRY